MLYRNLLRIFSTVFFSFLSIILFVLTLVSPGDIIYQSHTNHRLGNIFAISGVYIFTLLLAILIYASRIFTTRSILAGIPKSWIPVEKPDVGKSVRRLVVEGLARSSVIAQQAKPRDRSGEDTNLLDPSLTIPKDEEPPWGTISHPGWTAPESNDLPNQEFEHVIRELPHLMEAKAVSLAPTDPRLLVSGLDQNQSVGENTSTDVPDERTVEILQRPQNMCFRDYINHLIRLNLIDDPQSSGEFIQLYDSSRFSSRPLNEIEFRKMVGLFAEILRCMKTPDPAMIAEFRENGSFCDSRESVSGQSFIYRSETASLNSRGSARGDQDGGSHRRYHPSIYSSSEKSLAQAEN